MSLIVPKWGFARCTHNLLAGSSLTVPGLLHNPGTSNADSTPATLLSALAHDVHRVVFTYTGNVSGADCRILCDILIDYAGGTSWGNFIDDLYCGYGSSVYAASAGGGFMWDIPIFIPAGASLGIQARTNHTTAPGVRAAIYALGEPDHPEMWWCGTKAHPIGITDASNTLGTSVTSGNSSAWGSWTDFGSTLTHRLGSIQYRQGGSSNNSTSLNYFFQIGHNSTPLPGSPLVVVGISSLESGIRTLPGGSIPCDLPIGTQLQIRGMCSGTAEAMTFGGIGVS